MNPQLTDSAKNQIAKLCSEHDAAYIRLSVDGGGCQGFQYVWGFADAAQADDLMVGRLVIDATSQPFLNDATIDYIDSLSGAHFKITNPQATSSCGCGTSFAV